MIYDGEILYDQPYFCYDGPCNKKKAGNSEYTKHNIQIKASLKSINNEIFDFPLNALNLTLEQLSNVKLLAKIVSKNSMHAGIIIKGKLLEKK